MHYVICIPYSKLQVKRREHHGYSIPEFVKTYNFEFRTQLNAVKVRDYEKGTLGARMQVVENIAYFFNVSADELLNQEIIILTEDDK